MKPSFCEHLFFIMKFPRRNEYKKILLRIEFSIYNLMVLEVLIKPPLDKCVGQLPELKVLFQSCSRPNVFPGLIFN